LKQRKKANRVNKSKTNKENKYREQTEKKKRKKSRYVVSRYAVTSLLVTPLRVLLTTSLATCSRFVIIYVVSDLDVKTCCDETVVFKVECTCLQEMVVFEYLRQNMMHATAID